MQKNKLRAENLASNVCGSTRPWQSIAARLVNTSEHDPNHSAFWIALAEWV
jgi:hypothetical protein